MALRDAGDGERLHERLSSRELQILRLLGAGKKSREMAEAMHLSKSTIRTYRARLFEKMGFANVADAIRYVVEHELTP